ncbi:MAG TPA: MHYT domain-containing protein [Pseudonocardiaceae bacterium]
MDDFAMGGWMFALAYLTSVVGGTLGLACTLQARHAASEVVRLRWLALASVSIGGIGIWLMHFIGMLGFATPGMPVRYDIVRTALSAVIAIVAVFCGLLVFGTRAQFAWWRLFLGGLVTGVAVTLMHYTGMWAVRVQGTFDYNLGLVLLSVVIAVFAASAAFWFAVAFDRTLYRLLAGFVMGLAVCAVHYTGMWAVRLHLDMTAPAPTGVDVFSFLFPVFVLAGLATAVIICAVLTAPPIESTDDRRLTATLVQTNSG